MDDKRAARILIVEDEFLTAEMLSEYLQNAGFEICPTANTSEKALNTARGDHPDFVLMDVGLAGAVNGIDTARSIINEMNIPLAFMTGYTSNDVISRLQDLNPAGIFQKPVTLSDIAKLIKQKLDIY